MHYKSNIMSKRHHFPFPGYPNCCMKFRPLCKSAVSHKKMPSGTLTQTVLYTGCVKPAIVSRRYPCVKATFDVRRSKSTSNSPSCIQTCHEKRLIQLLVVFSSCLHRFCTDHVQNDESPKVTVPDVNNALSKIKIRKAPGPDRVSGKVFKRMTLPTCPYTKRDIPAFNRQPLSTFSLGKHLSLFLFLKCPFHL